MELSLICLTVLLIFNMSKVKKQDRRIRDLESFVDNLNQAVADVTPDVVAADVAI